MSILSISSRYLRNCLLNSKHFKGVDHFIHTTSIMSRQQDNNENNKNPNNKQSKSKERRQRQKASSSRSSHQNNQTQVPSSYGMDPIASNITQNFTPNEIKTLLQLHEQVNNKMKTPKSPSQQTPDKRYYPNNKKKHGSYNKLPDIKFEEYITQEECSKGLKRGTLIKGAIRINPRDFTQAFVSNPIESDRDIILDGFVSRNRALPDDIVAIELLPENEWKVFSSITNRPLNKDEITVNDNGLRLGPSGEPTFTAKTGKVVYLIEKKNPRAATGHLNVYKNNAFGFALFSPSDNRLPRLMIPFNECPEDFKKRPQDFEKILFVAYITNWNFNMAFASGKLMRSLGEAGHIEPETEAILVNNNIDSKPFPNEVLQCLPDGKTWAIPSEELDKRRDLRGECIFTVDPSTARDLDDALSCEKIGDDLYQVGVHIADVSYFIDQGNALDKIAASRGTSVYLAQKVIPMLPSVLCEELCSLNPGVERLAYSVIWKLRGDGTVLEEWFGRTVIKSCTKLSYDHAQELIQAEDGVEHETSEFPEIHGGFSLPKIKSVTKALFNISKHLRQKRFDSGALRLDQPKLSFSLNKESGLPNGCFVYEYKDSNRMIEEFMLLANMAVAHKIHQHEPDRAILRCHPPPNPKMMDDLENLCNQYDIEFDITSSSTISKSLMKILELESEHQEVLLPALTLMCTKPFRHAQYFCTGAVGDEDSYRHYALNVPLYTHFTSPIRRYPDVLVHRFLTSALNEHFKVDGKIADLQCVAEHCNEKKVNAKKASEQSSDLFFNAYVAECGPIIEDAVVVAVLDKAIDVLCTKLGVVKRIYCDKLSLYIHKFEPGENFKPKLTLHWRKEEKLNDLDVDEKIKRFTQKFEKKCEIEKKLKEQPDNDDVIPDDAITQEIYMFMPVKVVLSVEKNTPTKMNVLLRNPFENESSE